MDKRNEIVICLTGGGTAGHVIPHLALLPYFKKQGWRVVYIGTGGIEKTLISRENIEFHEISAGKLRRYFSMQNFWDLFRLVKGVLQAFAIIWRIRPDLVFSKGGFVSVPVVVGAWLLRIPVVAHESDITPGLANRLMIPLVRKLLFSFPQSQKHLPPAKSVWVGTPIRNELFRGDRLRGLAFCGWGVEKLDLPTILVIGGSSGSQRINNALVRVLPTLVSDFKVVHIVGNNNKVAFTHENYRQFEYIHEELKDVFQLSDYVLARAGANSIFEFLALGKPMLLIPLELGSRGDQLHNARSFVDRGWAMMQREGDLSDETLLAGIKALVAGAASMKAAQKSGAEGMNNQRIIDLLKTEVESRAAE